MPKLVHKPPRYGFHASSGRARVQYQGKEHFFPGPYGSPESLEAYAQFIARLAAGRASTEPERPRGGPPALLTVAELIERYWAHAQTYYRRADGTSTGEAIVIRAAIRPLLRLFGRAVVAEFSVHDLKLVRTEMIRLRWSRRHINASVRRIRRMFRWGVEEGIVPPGVVGALAAVSALKEGRSEAREKALPGPVADEHVAAVLDRVSPCVADAIRVMRLSGARPGEVLAMTVEAVDRTDPECWEFRPAAHKTRHRGRTRVVYLGPRAQAILAPWIAKAGSGRVFPLGKSGLRDAISRACARAGIPRWAPNQLRHAAATEIRRRFGLEGAQVILGHATAKTTEIYAAVDAGRAREVARLVG